MRLRVCAIIVTHNRPTYLSNLLEKLKEQTRPPDFLIIIDDIDSPNVGNLIRERMPEGKWKYIRMRRNLGLFGGLYIGMKRAYEFGYDALWLLDDDCIPEKDCLKKLMKHIIRIGFQEPVVLYPAHIDLFDCSLFTEPINIKIGKNRYMTLDKLPSEKLRNSLFESKGGPNIGPIMTRKVIELAGLPRPDMFFCGECEYFSRIIKSGVKILRCFDAKIFHKRHMFKKVTLFKKFVIFISFPPIWHEYYEIRNNIYTLKLNRGLKIKELIGLLFVFCNKIIYNEQKLKRTRVIFKAVCDGFCGKLGITYTKESIFV